MLSFVPSAFSRVARVGSLAVGIISFCFGATAFSAVGVVDDTIVDPAGVEIDAAPAPARTAPLHIQRFHTPSAIQSKFLTFPANGWAGGIIHWLYNDAGRLPSVASAAAMVSIIQAQQTKWSAVCNVQFIYDGPTTVGPSLLLASPPTPPGAFDGLNVIAWATQASPQTGVTAVGYGSAFVEGDMELNNSFNPNVDITVLHELGHMLGLNHSNVQGAVMSGPPDTTYVQLSTLQADDIAGCQSLYGAPVNTTRTISGTITNSGAVTGVTFCARPAVGVTCSASNGTGYSCTVPNNWAGTLHSRSVSGNRIPAQIFSAVTTNTTRNVTALTGIPTCNLDVDDNGLFEPDIDGVAIMRRMMGFASAAFAGLSGACAANTTATAISNATSAVANYNVTGGALTRPATDGLVILRAMRGLTNTAVTNGLGLTNEAGATRTTWGGGIQNFLNTTCGASF